ncbi:hypothetical protein [Mycoplasma sp. MV126]|uniref:hypothetical protein n=1 Tax=Mycoplasma sp. MV126 TaxID=3401676 RepID=UPI003AAB5336
MEKIKTILCLTTIGTFATLPMVSSSCTHQDQPELNGQKLYKNAQLAANYNALKKSNVTTINHINSLFLKINPKFNKKISINASAFIDWANVEAILKYNEKYSDKQWYKMLVGNLYDTLISNENLVDSLTLDFVHKDTVVALKTDINQNVIFNKNSNLVNAYILNNYIKYILDIVERNNQGKKTNNIYWINNVKDILKKLVVPSAYIIDPSVVEANSSFLSLKNNNLWDIFLNKNKYISTIISPLDLTESDFKEIDKISDEIIQNIKEKIKIIDPGMYDWDDNDRYLMSKITPKITISSWKDIIEKINLNQDYSPISLQKATIAKNDENYFVNINLKIPKNLIQNYKIENTNKNKNETSIRISFDNSLPLNFESFKNNYGKLIRNAVAYTLWMNITALKPFNPKPKDIDDMHIKYCLLSQDEYSYMLFDQILLKLIEIKTKETSLELNLPINSLDDKNSSNIAVNVKIDDRGLTIFDKKVPAEINSK